MCDGEQVALGTVVSADGYILTKASELEDQISCQLADGRLLDAVVVGVEPLYDLAMLKVDADDLAAVQWSEDDSPPLGSWVATPGMAEIPVGIGVVSVSPRPIAAPSGVLGVFLEQSENGPQITAIKSDSAADKAGLKTDDLVTHVNRRPVETREALIRAVKRFRPGDKLRLSVQRGDQRLEIIATLGGWRSESRNAQPGFQESLGGPLSGRRAGFPMALQHDTVLLPRTCGGPLVNLDGQTIGVNIARADRVATYAIPASAVKPLLADLQSGKLAPAPAEQDASSRVVQNSETVQDAGEHVDRRDPPVAEGDTAAKDSDAGLKSSLSAPQR
jgi:serine protease Do